MTDVGTLAWVDRTGGRLTWPDRATLAARAASQLTWVLPRYLAHRVGWPAHPPATDLAALTPPDTAMARAAQEHLLAHAPAFLVNHSLRSYWLSRLIGIDLGADHDDEVLWVAALLHDAGMLGAGVDGSESPLPCFAARGAETVAELGEGVGWDGDACERAAEAVSLHLNGVVAPSAGVEAHLLGRGVVMDVTGMWAWQVDRAATEEVFRRHPYLDQRHRLLGAFRAEADTHPGCRAAFARRWLRFETLARLAPWDR